MMNRTKKIYFLFSFVMIIACYALNKSYSMFVQTEEKNAVDSSVPNLNSELSVNTITLNSNEEYLIKQTITNTGDCAFNYSLNSKGSNYTIKVTADENNNILGSLEPNTSNILYLYVKNNSTSTNTITFNLDKKYTTLNNDLTSNIDTTDKYVATPEIPYNDEPETLKYKILYNYVNSDLYTPRTIENIFTSTTENKPKLPLSLSAMLLDPITKPAEAISTSTEKEISHAEDDYGTSYYFRGNVDTNYVNFAGMCWRAVRIAGDGSIKLILEDQDSTCATSDGNWNIPTTTGGTTKTGNFGYTLYAANTLTASDGTKNSSARYLMNYLNGGTNNDKSMATAFKNFQTGPLANYLDKLKAGDWCLNDKAYATETDNTTALTSQEMLDKQIKGTTFYYDSYVRLDGKTTKEPTLKCNGTNMSKFSDNTDMYVGTLTVDEIVYAGGKVYINNPDYYLINDYQKSFWSLSPYRFKGSYDSAFSVEVDSDVAIDNVNFNRSFRPAVTLSSNVQIIGGDGTKANAYTIE